MKRTRALTAGLSLSLLALMIAADLAAGGMPNPYNAPPMIALGSGQAPSGALCSSVPQ